ncbi:MAG: hypothetical protein JXM79_15440 [Sedimentisphaerales bacterium]|nr:hypothetical protein [Sedimentisphaerales bacterium]
MTMDQLKDLAQNKQKLIPIVLIGIAAFSGVTAIAKATGYWVAQSAAKKLVEKAIDRSKPNPEEVERQVAKSKPVAEELKKKNLFSPPEPKQHPINSVLGIFGDEALINDKWYKVGDKVGDARIVAIGPTSVTTEWEGKEKVFRPIDASAAPESGDGPKSRPSRPTPKPGGPGGGPADMVVVQSQGSSSRGPEQRGPSGRGPGGPGERFSRMSEADRNQMRERYMQMSEAERERFRAEMRERFSGGRGDRGGRR